MSNNTREGSIVFSALPFDAEGAVWLHGRFLLVDSAHIGEARSLRETLAQFVKFRRRAGGVDLYTAVVQIARVAGELQFGCRAFDEVAEAHSLYASANEVTSGGCCHLSYGVEGGGTRRLVACSKEEPISSS